MMYSLRSMASLSASCFISNPQAPPVVHTLSLHDALPIYCRIRVMRKQNGGKASAMNYGLRFAAGEIIVIVDADSLIEKNTLDRKSTRLNSSHLVISYAVFCLKKKKKRQHQH